MSSYVAIKEEHIDGKVTYKVNAISLKNTNNVLVQCIPHPVGTDVLTFTTLEDAKDAIIRAGFKYVLPTGESGGKEVSQKAKYKSNTIDYDQYILDTVKSKINSTNPNVVASAIQALAEFPCEETFNIMFEKLGEDNDIIRKNAIAGICRYSGILEPNIINALKSPNWIVRNSILTCIKDLANSKNCDLERFLLPLVEACNDTNSIVQTNAISTLALIYREYKKSTKD